MLQAKQRKSKPCHVCDRAIRVGEMAWFPIVESAAPRIHRGMRVCVDCLK